MTASYQALKRGRLVYYLNKTIIYHWNSHLLTLINSSGGKNETVRNLGIRFWVGRRVVDWSICACASTVPVCASLWPLGEPRPSKKEKMASSSARLTGKVVFITGAAQGIGKATALVRRDLGSVRNSFVVKTTAVLSPMHGIWCS